MSLFGSLMADVEDDPFFGSHMRHMHQMNNMMNSLLSDPFGMLGGMGGMGGGPLAIGGPHHGGALMPFMPQMPSLNRLFSGDLGGGMMNLAGMNAGSSFSSSTVVMSSGPNGKPQVYSSSSSTKIGPNGVKETRKTLQDTRTGTKKMSIGHHIGERAHVIEREHNLYSGDQEETQEFINLDEDEAEDFDREFQQKATGLTGHRRSPPRLALPPAPSAPPAKRRTQDFNNPLITALQVKPVPSTQSITETTRRPTSRLESSRRDNSIVEYSRRSSDYRPSARRPLRTTASPLTMSSSASVREVYGGSHPQRHRHKSSKAASRHTPPQ